jgi:hypothetical protein
LAAGEACGAVADGGLSTSGARTGESAEEISDEGAPEQIPRSAGPGGACGTGARQAGADTYNPKDSSQKTSKTWNRARDGGALRSRHWTQQPATELAEWTPKWAASPVSTVPPAGAAHQAAAERLQCRMPFRCRTRQTCLPAGAMTRTHRGALPPGPERPPVVPEASAEAPSFAFRSTVCLAGCSAGAGGRMVP